MLISARVTARQDATWRGIIWLGLRVGRLVLAGIDVDTTDVLLFPTRIGYLRIDKYV